MKKINKIIITLLLLNTSIIQGTEVINESSFEKLRELNLEEYDSGYGLWDSADIELFSSEDENFIIGLWKSKAGSEEIDTPFPYNVFYLLKSGEIETVTGSGETNRFVSGDGFLIPKGWMGSFSIKEDVELIYFYDGIVQTKNNPDRDIYKDARVHYNKDTILQSMSSKEFEEDEYGLTTKEQMTFNNKDESFSMGLWESSKTNIPSDWSYDELMFVITGQIIMTDENNNVFEVNPGEGIIVSSGWKGNFAIPDEVVKIWAIYDPK